MPTTKNEYLDHVLNYGQATPSGKRRGDVSMILTAIVSQVMLGVAMCGWAMRNSYPVDYTQTPWCNEDLDILLSVPEQTVATDRGGPTR